jgi:hypothetical protein
MTMTMDINTQLLQPNRAQLFKIFKDPKMRPPIFDEMWPDIQGVIHKLALLYTDNTTPHLQYDELSSKGMEKLAIIINNGILERLKTREEFFKFFRTAINNHLRGQVQKYRFTHKRTGIKPTAECDWCNGLGGDRNAEMPLSTCVRCHGSGKISASMLNAPTKPIEVSLDNEDANLQVPETATAGSLNEQLMLSDLESLLTPLEFLVLRQIYEPNRASFLLAELNSRRNHAPRKPSSVHVDATCLAEGLGLSLKVFREVELAIQQKVKNYMSNENDNAQYNQALSALENAFGVQTPRHFDVMVIRRLFTIAARDQYDKVVADPTLRVQLQTIGAKVPEMRGPMLTCYGVLYQKGHRTCEACQLNTACMTEAKNFGLGEIILGPDLLGGSLASQLRVAALVGSQDSDSSATRVAPAVNVIADDATSPGASTESVWTPPQKLAPADLQRDDEIRHYLGENFKPIKIERKGRSEVAYKHKDVPPSGDIIIFCLVNHSDNQLYLRFSSPSDAMRGKLERRRNGHYLTAETTTKDAIALINQHAKEKFV